MKINKPRKKNTKYKKVKKSKTKLINKENLIKNEELNEIRPYLRFTHRRRNLHSAIFYNKIMLIYGFNLNVEFLLVKKHICFVSNVYNKLKNLRN